MSNAHLVVDGSNIATEGRTAPSLAQLSDAVIEFTRDHQYDNVVVVVDATFPNRIDDGERAEFEEAILAGELLTPPAGAVGRGDAFVLQIADRTGATVLSNDSFQEFHATYAWLFDDDRLWGGKPVPGVGWVFVPRVPVKGPVSRRAYRDAKNDFNSKDEKTERAPAGRPSTKQPARKRAARKQPEAAPEPPAGARKRSTRRKSPAAKVDAPAGNAEATAATSAGRKSPAKKQAAERRRSPSSGEPVNTPPVFLNFVTAHQPGAVVQATVVEFSSHGAYVDADGARCYVPLKSMGDPAPRSAREALTMGEVRPFIVQGFDTPRRGIDLALPGADDVGTGSSEPKGSASRSRRAATVGSDIHQPILSEEPAEEAAVAVKKKAPAKRKAPAKKKAPANRKAPAKRAPAKKKAPAKRAPAKKKAPAKRAPAKKKAPARRR